MKPLIRILCSVIVWALVAQAAPATRDQRVQLSNLRVNPINGLAQVDATLTSPPLPRLGTVTGRIKVKLTSGGVDEEIEAGVGAVNVKRTVNSARPLACNQETAVSATVTEPSDVAGHSITANLTRKCTGGAGTPDLAVISVVRTDRGLLSDAEYLKQPRETPIQLTITVKNVAAYRMPFNEQGGTPWAVQVTPGTPMQGPMAGTQRIMRALGAGEEHKLLVQPVAIPCGKLSDITVEVDSGKVILESDETNNKKTFKIPGNICQDAG